MIQSKVCPSCQNRVPSGEQRCDRCGHELEAAKEAAGSEKSSKDLPKPESGDKVPIGKVSGQIPVFSPTGPDASKGKQSSMDAKNESSGLTEMSTTVPAENDASRPGSYVFVDKNVAERKKQRREESAVTEAEGAPDSKESSSESSETQKQGDAERAPSDPGKESDVHPSVADILPDKTQRVVADSTDELLFGENDLPSYLGKNKGLAKLYGILIAIKRLFRRNGGARKSGTGYRLTPLFEKLARLGGRPLFSKGFLDRLEQKSSLAAMSRIAKRLVLWHVVATVIVLFAIMIMVGCAPVEQSPGAQLGPGSIDAGAAGAQTDCGRTLGHY